MYISKLELESPGTTRLKPHTTPLINASKVFSSNCMASPDLSSNKTMSSTTNALTRAIISSFFDLEYSCAVL